MGDNQVIKKVIFICELCNVSPQTQKISMFVRLLFKYCVVGMCDVKKRFS